VPPWVWSLHHPFKISGVLFHKLLSLFFSTKCERRSSCQLQTAHDAIREGSFDTALWVEGIINLAENRIFVRIFQHRLASATACELWSE